MAPRSRIWPIVVVHRSDQRFCMNGGNQVMGSSMQVEIRKRITHRQECIMQDMDPYMKKQPDDGINARNLSAAKNDP